MYISSFVKIGLGVEKLLGVYTCRHTHRQHCDLIILLLFFQSKESKLKIIKKTGSTRRQNSGKTGV
jgi:hypothetical protein